MNKSNPRLQEELGRLPDHYHETFSRDFLELLAALRLLGFSIQRADEASPVVESHSDLWSELSHPSVWLYAPKAPTRELRDAEPGTPEHQKLTNDVIRVNLAEQRRLLALLADFYNTHTPDSISDRLIIETVDLGESYLRSQGASVRLVLDEESQKQWARESRMEMMQFKDYLLTQIGRSHPS